ncbi:hypothetical protein [Legionella micdadei]|uniref:Uncharacterized protein n=1 Tax=Legionella micdadei TaxID=451 RepID=A0A098GEH7_LEGMI|nr:hypothetical protein [Legionella micdadei]ARG97976.1 hypothetical protein B6N58_10070 [Legionella micdadei]ARG99706.1 hypothetical protein B6V88_04345 [Legionella micdadei]KTD30227.1 hypothetical protein Lmic_0182 [Legionella micdadei]NSL19231.1 hypothetical protein [Legionella micdadei]CEG60402.1 conserved protein of unknown function [Legionella micdadei]
MNRNKFIKSLVSQFEAQISKLPDHKLEELESGKLEISLTQAVGSEAGGAAAPVKKQPTKPAPATATATKARMI